MLALGKNDFPTNLHVLRFLYLCFPPLMNSEIQKDLEQRNYYKNPIAAPRLRRGFLEIQPIAARKLRIPPILSTMSTRGDRMREGWHDFAQTLFNFTFTSTIRSVFSSIYFPFFLLITDKILDTVSHLIFIHQSF